MALPFVSLNAATATGPGSSNDLEGLFSHHTLIASVTASVGSPSVSVALEGSHDGTVWCEIDQSRAQPSVTSAASTTATDPLVRYVRANLLSLSGGTSPAVTATIASDTDEED